LPSGRTEQLPRQSEPVPTGPRIDPEQNNTAGGG